MSRYIFSKNSRWYISEVFDPSDSKLQEKASYYTLTDDVTGPYYAVGTSDSASIGVSYVPVMEPAGGADVTLGVVDSQGRFQALRFNGTQASNSGSAIQVQNYKTWNSTLPVPSPAPSAGMDFYKCAYVNSDSWGGYKAVLTQGHYQFESNSTEGLHYSAVTPIIGRIYIDGALAQAALYEGLPLSGLLLYAPLKTQQAAAETGQAITYENPAFTTFQGIECMQCQGDTYAIIAMQDIPQGDSPRTISFWAYATGDPSSVTFVSQGQDYANELINICLSMGNLAMNFSYNDHSSQYNPTGAWHHYALTYDGSNAILYVDAAAKISAATTLDTNGTDLRIAYFGFSGYFNLTGYIAAVRVYDHALSSAEITALSAEFTPVVS